MKNVQKHTHLQHWIWKTPHRISWWSFYYKVITWGMFSRFPITKIGPPGGTHQQLFKRGCKLLNCVPKKLCYHPPHLFGAWKYVYIYINIYIYTYIHMYIYTYVYVYQKATFCSTRPLTPTTDLPWYWPAETPNPGTIPLLRSSEGGRSW